MKHIKDLFLFTLYTLLATASALSIFYAVDATVEYFTP